MHILHLRNFSINSIWKNKNYFSKSILDLSPETNKFKKEVLLMGCHWLMKDGLLTEHSSVSQAESLMAFL